MHSVLQLPVPPLEDWVRERTRHYDAGFVSADPEFGHAHITVLAPFVPDPTPTDLAAVAEIASDTAPFEVRLGEVDTFPNGIIHLRIDPEEPVRAMTRAALAAFPGLTPYEGIFGPEPPPHLTLDAAGETVSQQSTRELLGDLVPMTCVLDRLQLAWWDSGNCHVIRGWGLGT